LDAQRPAHPLDALLLKLQQWTKLSALERDAVLALPCKVESVAASKYIVREGDVATHSCLLISGFAFRQKLVANGGRSISAIHMRGDMVDLQNSLLGVADHSVQTLTRCEIAFVPREAIKSSPSPFRMSAWHCGMTHSLTPRFSANGLPTSPDAMRLPVSPI
jgi:CRP-like cAMP-binding protein